MTDPTSPRCQPYFVDTCVVIDAMSPHALFQIGEEMQPDDDPFQNAKMVGRTQRMRDALAALVILTIEGHQLYIPSEIMNTLKSKHGDPEDLNRPAGQHNSYVFTNIIYNTLYDMGAFQEPQTLFPESGTGSNEERDKLHLEVAREVGAVFMTTDAKRAIAKAREARNPVVVSPAEWLADYDQPWPRARAEIQRMIHVPKQPLKDPTLYEKFFALLDFLYVEPR